MEKIDDSQGSRYDKTGSNDKQHTWQRSPPCLTRDNDENELLHEQFLQTIHGAIISLNRNSEW